MIALGLIFAFASACSYAVMNVCVRKATDRGGSEGGVLIALVANVVMHGAVVVSRTAAGAQPSGRTSAIVWFATAGVMTAVFGRAALYSAIRRIGPSRSTAIKNAAPLFSVCGGLFLLGEHLSRWAALGIAIALAGYFIFIVEGLLPAPAFVRTPAGAVVALARRVSMRALSEKQSAELRSSGASVLTMEPVRSDSHGRAWVALGYIFCFGAAIFYGSGAVVRKVGITDMPDPYFAALISALSGLIVYVLYLRLRGNLSVSLSALRTQRHPYFWIAGAISTVGQLSAYLAVAHAPVSYVSIVASSDTILTPLLATFWLARKDAVNAPLVVAAALVFIGTVFIFA